MPRLQTITRNELFAIFKNEKIVRAFESLIAELNNAPDTLNQAVEDIGRLEALTNDLALGAFDRPRSTNGTPPAELTRIAVAEAAVFLPRQPQQQPEDPLQAVLRSRVFGPR